jgi:hypothetical protein
MGKNQEPEDRRTHFIFTGCLRSPYGQKSGAGGQADKLYFYWRASQGGLAAEHLGLNNQGGCGLL